MKKLFAAVLAASVMSSWAGLGGAPSGPGPRVLSAQSNAGSTGQAAFTDRERKLDSGTTVHEFVDANGIVFAVSWSGPYLPDLKELLGKHFDTMVAHANGMARSGRTQLALRQGDLVIVSGGHMGAFQGKAWLPARLPAGFDAKDIK